jgi:hypothetical protein
MTTLIIVSSIVFVLSIVGFNHAISGAYTVDAAPAGSILALICIVGFVLSLVMFGIVVGMMIGR